jgi:putative peptidoglycan lipid II flippase
VSEALPVDQVLADADEMSDTRLARDAMVVTVCTLLSRVTGFVRVLVAAAVLSNGVLGDTYHAANIVPNLLFELVAGGVLQAVLIPSFVASRREGGDEALGRAAGSVVAVLSVVLGAIALLVMLAAPWLARALTSLDSDPQVSADKLRVMTLMLLVFIPQILFYGIGMISTAALAARRRFAAAALAPMVNNLVVIVCYLLYRASRPGEEASLDLDAGQFLLLAGGTTLAVVAFTAVPGVVLRVQGVRWHPRWLPGDPAVRSLRASVGWAMLSVLGTLLPTAGAVVLGYGVPGGVAVFMFSWAFFVLPHALIAVPVATAIAPRVADSWQRSWHDVTTELIERSARVVVPLLVFAGAAMATLAWPIARVAASFGQAASQGLAPIAHALTVFGFGLVGYGMAFIMTRVLFSLDDVRGAATLGLAAALCGVGVMVLASAAADDGDRAAALALGYGATQTMAALLLTLRVRSLTGAPSWAAIGRLGAGAVVAAVGSGAVMLQVQRLFGTDRVQSVAAIATSALAGLFVFMVLARPLTGVAPRDLLRPGLRSDGSAAIDGGQ